MKNLEIEYKWEANAPRAFAEMLKAVKNLKIVRLSRPQKLSICDVYLDHPDYSFEREELAFRVRNTGTQWEATFKTRTEIVDGRAMRREETLPLPGVKNAPEALEKLNQKKHWCGLNVTQLVPLFEIHNQRTIYQLTWRKNQAELALDNCMVHVCGRKVCFKEIELELKKGSAEQLTLLAEELSGESGLAAAKISKVKTAVMLRELWSEK